LQITRTHRYRERERETERERECGVKDHIMESSVVTLFYIVKVTHLYSLTFKPYTTHTIIIKLTVYIIRV